MKVILAFALFIAIASAGFAPVLRFVKEKMAKVDCDTCYSDILDAASASPLKTLWNVLKNPLVALASTVFVKLLMKSVLFLDAAGAVELTEIHSEVLCNV